MLAPSPCIKFCLEFMRILQQKKRVSRTVIYVLSKKWNIDHPQMEFLLRRLKVAGLISKPAEPNVDFELGNEYLTITVDQFCVIVDGPDYAKCDIPEVTAQFREKMSKLLLDRALNGVEVKL